MTEWEAQRATVAAGVAAVDLAFKYKHDLLKVGETLEEFIDHHVARQVGKDYLGYRSLFKPVMNYLDIIAEERGFNNLQCYWDAKIEGYM